MNWMKIGKKLLFPPIWVMVLLTLASAAALVTVFLRGAEQTVFAYGIYALSFYTLVVDTVFCALVLPKQYRQIREQAYSIPLVNRYLTDRDFRNRVSLYLSLGVNLLYVCTNLWSWYLIRSWWFVVLAVYYVIMAVMRFLLAGYVHSHDFGTELLKEWQRSRVCAYILLLVNLSLSGAVLMILYQSKGYAYPGVMIYVMALYTFYSTIHAIVDTVKYRKMESPILSTAKAVSLSAALVSMLNLETAMFAQFGADMAPEHQRIFIILPGAGVSISIITLSVRMIVKATNAIRREKYGTK